MTQPTIRGRWCEVHDGIAAFSWALCNRAVPHVQAFTGCRFIDLITLTDAEAMRGRCAECSKAIVDAQSLITLSAAEALVKAERERCASDAEDGGYFALAARIREGK